MKTLIKFVLAALLSINAIWCAASTLTLSAPNSFLPQTSNVWHRLGKTLVDTHYDTYVIYWQGMGGSTDMADRFIGYIKQAQAQGKSIQLYLTGSARSMHAEVVCYADKLINPNNNFLMFHAYSIDIGRTTYSEGYTTHQVPNFNQCVAKGYLTREAIKNIYSGYMYFKSNTTHWYQKDTRPRTNL